jgi:hypothetical protein
MNSPIFPLDKAASFLGGFCKDFERGANSLRWRAGDGFSELKVTSGGWNTFDGLVVREIVTLTHVAHVFGDVPPADVARLNAWSTLSSFVPTGPSGPARLVAKISVFDGDHEAAERVYAPLLCTEAAVSGWHASQLMRGRSQANPSDSPLSVVDRDPPYNQADFEAAKAITDRSCFLGSLGNRHFTVEFPWKAGAVSRMLNVDEIRKAVSTEKQFSDERIEQMGGATSLLQIHVARHPFYGPGIHCMLELPLSVEGEDAVALVNGLNEWELSGPDLPPHLGAWSLGERAPAYVCFLPTQYALPGLLQNLTVWMRARAARAREWLQAPETWQ